MQNANKKKSKGKKKPDKVGDERAAPERPTEALHQSEVRLRSPPLLLPVHRFAAPPC